MSLAISCFATFFQLTLFVISFSGQLLIVIYEKDLFDFQRGEPPENFLTVLRALDVSRPFIKSSSRV